MADIINLNKRRKLKARQDAAQLAAENRIRFGRSKAYKQRDRAEAEAAAHKLDQLRREAQADDDEKR